MTTLYTTREEWLNAFVDAARPHFIAAGSAIPENCRVSIGFPSAGYRSSVIGECWSDTASADGHFEIFLNPTTESDARIADILTHELCHAALGIAEDHGPNFRRLATALGLAGPMRATIAGPDWIAWALPILRELGEMPYAAIKGGMKPPRKKKKTFTHGHTCIECGTQIWMTRKNYLHLATIRCIDPDCDGVMLRDKSDEELGI